MDLHCSFVCMSAFISASMRYRATKLGSNNAEYLGKIKCILNCMCHAHFANKLLYFDYASSTLLLVLLLFSEVYIIEVLRGIFIVLHCSFVYMSALISASMRYRASKLGSHIAVDLLQLKYISNFTCHAHLACK